MKSLCHLFSALAILVLVAGNVGADTLCAKKKQRVVAGFTDLSKGIVRVPGACPAGTKELISTVSFIGPKGDTGAKGDKGEAGSSGSAGVNGAPGADGADGQLRIYGDSTAGDVTISGSVNWAAAPPQNLQFGTLTIEASASLTVSSGTVIRCSGTFNNNGTIVVQPFSNPGSLDYQATAPLHYAAQNPGGGIADSPAGNGEVGDNSASRFGGAPGRGLTSAEARMITYPGHTGGGGGGAGLYSYPGRGGGTLVVLAGGGISNLGSISADGEDGASGGGGGAGGIVVLASPVTVTNGGTVQARGGRGGNGTSESNAGGGGGGGILHFLAPVVEEGTRMVQGGAGGNPSGSLTTSMASGGGGGGSCGSTGAYGANTTAAIAPGQADSGRTLVSLLDPTALF